MLEDDCLPHPSFFRFCQEMLDYYRNDERVMFISGDNFQSKKRNPKYSYYFLHIIMFGDGQPGKEHGINMTIT